MEIHQPQGRNDYPLDLGVTTTPNPWIIPGWFFSGHNNSVVGANTIYWMPIFVSATTTFDRIAIFVSTGAAGNADLRIYEWSGGLPGAQILSAGTVSHASAGSKEITISQQLNRGFYFLGTRCTGTPTLSGISVSGNMCAPVSGREATNVQTRFGHVGLGHAAAYTDPAGTPTGYNQPSYCFNRLRIA